VVGICISTAVFSVPEKCHVLKCSCPRMYDLFVIICEDCPTTISTNSSIMQTNMKNLFVAGLPPNVDDSHFKSMFESFGKVKSAKVMLDIHSGVSRGFGFILFEQLEDATEALKAMHGSALDHGGTLHVAFSRHDGQCALMATDKMYIRNLPLSVSKAELIEFLTAFGVVESVSLRPDSQHTGANTNVALVAFADDSAVEKAVAAVHGHSPFPSCTVPLMAKPCEPADHRQKRLATVRKQFSPPVANTSSHHHQAQNAPPMYMPSPQQMPAPTYPAMFPPAATGGMHDGGTGGQGPMMYFPPYMAPPPQPQHQQQYQYPPQYAQQHQQHSVPTYYVQAPMQGLPMPYPPPPAHQTVIYVETTQVC
jgi:RNA recognition motif-containing protein